MGDIDTINKLVGSLSIDASVVTRAFKKAAEFGHVRVAERLLQESGVKPDAQFNWAIRVAAANNHVRLVDRLLREKSVDPTARSDWALVRAAERGHEAVVERLLKVPEVNAGARGNWYPRLYVHTTERELTSSAGRSSRPPRMVTVPLSNFCCKCTASTRRRRTTRR